jgi:hypothetical protein
MNTLAGEAGEMDGWTEVESVNGTSFVDCSMSRNGDSHRVQKKNSRSECQETKGDVGGSGLRSILGSYLLFVRGILIVLRVGEGQDKAEKESLLTRVTGTTRSMILVNEKAV